MCDPLTGSPSTAGPGYAVPCGAITKIQSGSARGDTNSLDPNFEMPTFAKLSIGMKKQIGDYDLSIDYMNSKNNDPFYVYNLANTVSGFAKTGHEVSTPSGCCTGDYVLANSSYTPETDLISVSVRRSFDNVDVSMGYTHTDAEDVHPMGSSVAYTNANENLVTASPNNPIPTRSNWEIKHRFVATLNWMVTEKTDISFFYNKASGNPYSLSAYGSWTELGYAPGWRTEDYPSIPLYISDESFVSYADSATANGLSGLGNGMLQRNAYTTRMSSRLDMKVTHDITDELNAYIVVRNLGNLIDSERGTFYQSSAANGIATASFDSAGNVEYSDYNSPSVNAAIGSASLWNIKIGFRYNY